MKQYAKQYGVFLAFMAVTVLLVRPTVKSLNVPMLTAVVGG